MVPEFNKSKIDSGLAAVIRAVKRSDGQHGCWRGQAVDRTARPVRISMMVDPIAKELVEQRGHGGTQPCSTRVMEPSGRQLGPMQSRPVTRLV